MRKKKWKIYVTDPENGETRMISDDQMGHYILDKIGGALRTVVRKSPAIAAIAVGARLIYNQGFRTGKSQADIIETAKFEMNAEDAKEFFNEMKAYICQQEGENDEF